MSISNFLAADSSQWLYNNLVPVVGAAIVVLGLAVFGISDLLRFSIKRIWAISGVCFDESIRRRVLWIIPLAILGLIIVVQLQQPFDEQDAIRQTTKFCLFATGMVVVISTIILACTNLPREIENRVIFTVVTKPTTRLEIVLGKITGFARVSATILLIMGVFSFAYLHFRAWSLESDLRDRLKINAVESISRPTFQHYVDAGLLNAKTFASPAAMNIYRVEPDFSSPRRQPTDDGTVLVPFRLPDDMVAVADPEGKEYTGPGIIVQVKVGYDHVTPIAVHGKVAAPQPPKLSLQVMDPNQNSLLSSEIKDSPAIIQSDGSTPTVVNFAIPSNYAATLIKYPMVYMTLANASTDIAIWLNDDPKDPAVRLIVPVTSDPKPQTVLPIGPPVFRAREGVTGMQLKGDPQGKSQVCVYRFRDVPIQQRADGEIPIEFRAGVEKSSDVGADDIPTNATLTVLNLRTGKMSDPVALQPENNRPFYTNIPSSFTDGGDFLLIIRCLSPDQWLNLRAGSIAIVQSEDSFAFNLLKSTVILWLLSILVISISIFCSTFLSWPIAVMLTLVILLGRWGVNELGDSATAGIGRQFVTDFGVKDPAAMEVLSGSVEELNKALKAVATVLPDIEQFSATDDIERGVSIPLNTVGAGGWVLLTFGLPLTVLAFVFFKNKEVAP
jgi:ABC-type transport system involved in multi-copper enzyme maturation permease subunit